jgi:RNA polymerase sigma-70 factor (ECF subfamily)
MEPVPRLDQDTLERVRRREEPAMDAFFQVFYPRVAGYVRAMTRDGSAADDVVQDAFVRLHRALPALDPARDPAPWVFTVVVNTLRDHWRRRDERERGRRIPFEDLWNEPAEDPDPAEAMDRATRRDRVRWALARLSPADREVVMLRTYEELDYDAIAVVLRVTAEAVRQRHSRAVKRLGRLYAEMSVEGTTS